MFVERSESKTDGCLLSDATTPNANSKSKLMPTPFGKPKPSNSWGKALLQCLRREPREKYLSIVLDTFLHLRQESVSVSAVH